MAVSLTERKKLQSYFPNLQIALLQDNELPLILSILQSTITLNLKHSIEILNKLSAVVRIYITGTFCNQLVVMHSF